ncbi:hypothetical protein [Myroides pelagicus]|uniref:DUF3168 domain-containing protein n=1 Tax=Myroides pelagicus TaxID=270914 RepID=A0A7K1GJJ4_9FLAO|nr:hypothetical protein [Myroides pelagicus]MTH28404.1 hypothetical protein [Myroides pelagicus]
MEKASEFIYDYFRNNSDFISEMNDRLSPLFVSEQSKKFPMAVYNIGESPQLTDNARVFPSTLSLCYEPENYMKAISFADKMKISVDEMPNAEFQSTQVVFDDENRYIYVNVNFNLIM